jgi:plastocyanin
VRFVELLLALVASHARSTACLWKVVAMTARRSATIALVPVLVLFLWLFSLLLPAAPAAPSVLAQQATTVEIYASGLVNPKGMAFGPDGTLYVAESGAPGDVMVPLPVNFGGEGPIGTNARVSKIPPGGERQDFITGLPNIGLYGGVEMLGAGSVALLGDQLYEVSAGHMTVSPLLSRVQADGTLQPVSDVGAFNDANPPPPSNGDAVPRGNPYDLVALGDKLYITDGNYNRVLEATTDGQLRILAWWENSPVTVGAAAGPDGNLYVSQFSPAPYNPGSGRIDRIAPDGTVAEGVVTGLTTPIDVAFAPDGTMYVLRYAAEFSPELKRYIAFGGEVQRVRPDGSIEPVVTNLVFPTAMTFGPDGALYVTNYGNESNKGEGQVLRVVPGAAPVAAPDVPPPDESGTYNIGQPTPTPVDVEPVLTINIVEPQDPMQWGYDPAEVTIEVGQAVTFTNTGRVAHTATASNGEFDTGLIEGGQSVTIVFNNPGEFDYFCTPHPWMKAKITVTGEGGAGEAAAVVRDEPDPPAISLTTALIFVAALIALVFGIGFALRRAPSPSVAPTSPPAPPEPPAAIGSTETD